MCYLKLKENDRQTIFNRFWRTGTGTRQWKIMYALVKERINRRGTRRSVMEYRLPNLNSNYELIKVCKIMFVNTFHTTERLVKTALTKKYKSNFKDCRGSHSNHRLIITQDKIDTVHCHIHSLLLLQIEFG